MTVAVTEAPDAARVARRPGLALFCVCVCTILVVGLVAAINLAVPMIAASGLHPGASELLWIVDAYVVVFACLVIPGGAAGDRFGRKGVLIGGPVGNLGGGAILSAAPGAPCSGWSRPSPSRARSGWRWPPRAASATRAGSIQPDQRCSWRRSSRC